MRLVRPNRLLAFYALMNVITMILVVIGLGWISVIALFSTYFFMSVMFPTIFALGIKELGPLTKKGSSVLVMSIAGGAIIPMIMGRIADVSKMAYGFIIPLVCFAFILFLDSEVTGSELPVKTNPNDYSGFVGLTNQIPGSGGSIRGMALHGILTGVHQATMKADALLRMLRGQKDVKRSLRKAYKNKRKPVRIFFRIGENFSDSIGNGIYRVIL